MATEVPSSAPPDTTAPTAPVATPDPTTPFPTTSAASIPAPTTTHAVTVTAAPTTSRVPSTLAPPRVEVLYAADAQNRLVIPRTGTATLTIRNSGGLASQWLVTGSGFSVRTASQGTVQGGDTALVVVGPPAGELPRTERTGTISVLGAVNSAIPFVIPAS